MILFSSKYSFMYVQVGKCACSSLTHWMGVIEGVRDPKATDDSPPTHESISKTIRLDQCDPDIRNNMLATWPALVVVRDPLTRLASCYLDKFCKVGQNGIGGFRDVDCSFRQFVVRVFDLVSGDPDGCDEHIRPQYTFRREPANCRLLPFDELCTYRVGQMMGLPPDIANIPRFKRTEVTPPGQHGCCANIKASRLKKMAVKPNHLDLYDEQLLHQVTALYRQDHLVVTEK